jgi:YD repeat-containing protein
MTYNDNGNLISLTDPEQNTTTFAYDGLDRQVFKTKTFDLSRTSSYDASGNLTQTVDHIVMNYSNDAGGNQITTIDGVETGTTTYTYDACLTDKTTKLECV